MADDVVAFTGGNMPSRRQAAARRLKELEARFRLARDPRERALIADALVPEYVTRGETASAADVLAVVTPTEDAELDACIASLRGIVAAMSGDNPNKELGPALDLLSMIPDRTSALVRHRAGVAYFFARRMHEAEEHSLHALWLAETNGLRHLAMASASVLYGVHYHLTGDLQAARYYAEVQGIEATAAGDSAARGSALRLQYDLAATFGEWDRASALRALLRRESFSDRMDEFPARVADCLMHGRSGDFAAMRGATKLVLDTAKQKPDFALAHGLQSLALAGLDLDEDARREARRALGLSRESGGEIELAYLTIRRRLGGILAAYTSALIGDVVRGDRALRSRAKLDGALGALAQILARSILVGNGVDISDPRLQSIKGYAAVAAAADAARARMHRADNGAVRTLTDTELVLLRLIASGKSNSEIAKERGVTRNAVERRLMSAYGKLGVRSRAEAIAKLHPRKN
jgi:DNA-binding CsgD family transcriptional regulator